MQYEENRHLPAQITDVGLYRLGVRHDLLTVPVDYGMHDLLSGGEGVEELKD